MKTAASIGVGFLYDPCNEIRQGVLMSNRATRNFSFVIAALVASTITVSRADADTSTCVFKDLAVNELCPAFAKARAIEFLDVGDDAVIFIDSEIAPPLNQAIQAQAPSSAGSQARPLRDRTSVVVSSRVEDAVLLEQIDEDEGMLLEREVQELSGARYELPASRREVKKQLGFPENAEIASEDWVEMIRVHAETVLSISAIASRFLLEQVGLVNTAPVPIATSSVPVAVPVGPSDPVVVETH